MFEPSPYFEFSTQALNRWYQKKSSEEEPKGRTLSTFIRSSSVTVYDRNTLIAI